MKKLLHFELRKLLRQKSFYICGAVSLAILLLGTVMMEMIFRLDPEWYTPRPVWDYILTALGVGGIQTIMAIITPLYVCYDYKNKTLKNIYAKGYSRARVYISKYIPATMACLLIVAADLIMGALMGAIYGAPAAFSAEMLWNLLAQIAVVICFNTAYFSVAMLLGKSGGCIAVNLLGPYVGALLLGIINSAINSEKIYLLDYWINGQFDTVMYAETTAELATPFIVSAVYLVLFLAGGWWLSRKKEV